VLPSDSIVLLVKANCVRQLLGSAIWLCNHGIKVFYHSKAVTPKGEIVGHVSTTAIAKVKGLLSMKRRTRIGVRYGLAESKLCELEKQKLARG
jgi:hypothetical protein